MQIKGVLSYPALWTPKQMKDAGGNPTGDPKYSVVILLPPNDPQIAAIHAEVEAAALSTFPHGFPHSGTKCLAPYDEKYANSKSYDPRFSGWHVLSGNAKMDSKPAVVNPDLTPVMDPAKVFSGMVVWANINIFGFTAGKGGVGGGLNGIMITDEESPVGRLDGKPTVEQMFAGIGSQQTVAPTHTPPQSVTTPPPVAPVAPPAAPMPPAAPVAQPQFVMTDKAAGMTRDQYLAAGWTDQMLVEHGYMLPGGVATSF